MPTDREPHDRTPEREASDEAQGGATPRTASSDGDPATSPAVVVQYGEDPGTVEDDERA
jgi:hypothetical protein